MPREIFPVRQIVSHCMDTTSASNFLVVSCSLEAAVFCFPAVFGLSFLSAMGTLLEFAEALKARAAALQVAPNEIALLIRQGTNTLSRLAFAACSPGQQATDEQVRALFPEGHVSIPGAVSSLKHLIFEAQTMVIADVKQRVARKDEVQPTALAAAERLNRIEDQRARLTGLRLRGEEEVAHSCYDMVLTMIERDALVYLSPDKFYTRRTELLQQKPKKELALDSATLTIRDKNPSLSCSTATELEAVNAFRRRSLAFDLVNLVNYDTMNTYHSELVDHMSLSPPPGYSAVSLKQILRADKAAFVYMAERLPSLKRDARGQSPLQLMLPTVLSQPSVSFHLLPLPQHQAQTAKKAPAKKRGREQSKSPPRGPREYIRNQPKGKGKCKSKKGPRISEGLIGKSLETSDGRRLCWAYNLGGCPDTKLCGTASRARLIQRRNRANPPVTRTDRLQMACLTCQNHSRHEWPLLIGFTASHASSFCSVINMVYCTLVLRKSWEEFHVGH